MQNKAINKVNNFIQQPIVKYTVVGVAGYFLIVRPILQKLGIVKSAQQAAQDKAISQNIDSYVNANINNGMTKTIGEWQIIANQIYEDLRYSAIADNKSDAIYQICRAKNDADFAALYKTFGQRQEYFFGIPYGGLQDLVSFVHSNFDNNQIGIINNNYSRKGISWQF